MKDDPNLTLLQDAGDPLEKLICQAVEPLFPVLSPYARVWAHHIYLRRIGDGSQVVAEWMSFGGSHNTALIRLYHAYRAKEHLPALCKKAEEVKDRKPTAEDYSLLLEVHATCAAFWENLGSAVDNFFRAWADAKKALNLKVKPREGEENEPTSGKTVSDLTYPKLNHAYARRTQFIHSRLVPKRLEDGMIVFNLRHYDDEKTVWLPETEEIESIDTQVAKDWNEVLNELGSAWERFFSWIQS